MARPQCTCKFGVSPACPAHGKTLEPCPLCACKVFKEKFEKFSATTQGILGFSYRCPKCRSQFAVFGKSEVEAMKVWNTRSAASAAPVVDEAMSSEQLARAALIAESRGIDLETAQELVYLRDRLVLNDDLRQYMLDSLEHLANASYTELRSSVETNREYTPEPHERFDNETLDTKHFKFYATKEEWAVAEKVSGWFQERIRIILDKLTAAAIAAPVDHNSIPLTTYERILTIEWDKYNARRHELIKAERSRVLSESEVLELFELQWLARIKHGLSSGPRVTQKQPLPDRFLCINPEEQPTVINFLRGYGIDADRELARLHLNLCLRCQELATAASMEQSDSLLAKITQIADIGSAEEFGDALERLQSIRKLVDEHEGAR